MRRVLAVLVVLSMVMSVFTGVVAPVPIARAATLDVGPGKTYGTVQEAVAAAAEGDTINVYPGLYDTGAYVVVDKRGLTIRGVSAGGTPIASAADVAATVGPLTGGEANMVFHVVANDVTISGVRIADQNDKAMTINGDNFTLTNCRFENLWDLSGAIYFYDATPGIKSDTDKSVQKSFTISGNVIKGWGVAITDGTGYGWPAANRVIANNTFGTSTLYPGYSFYSIGFRSVNGSGWCNSPVGGATITGNTFADLGSRGYIYFDGTVPVEGLDFSSILSNNTFALGAAMAFDSTGAPRTVLPSDPLYNATTRPNLVILANSINGEIAKAQGGDTINVAPGIYAGNITVNKSLTIVGDPGDAAPGPGVNAPIIDGGSLPGDAFRVANGVSNVTIKGFEIRNFTSNATGVGNGISAWQASTSNITIEDNWFHNLGWNGVLVGNDGATGDHASWLVRNNILEAFKAYGFELTNTSNSIIENNVIHADIASAPITCIMVCARRNESGITIRGNAIDGAMPDYSPGISAIYVFADDKETSGATLGGVLVEHNTISTTGTSKHLMVYRWGASLVTGVHAHHNSFRRVSNGGANVAVADATNNWWGDASGPYNQTTNPLGAGGTVSNNVIYAPWYDSAQMSQLAASGSIGTLIVPPGESLTLNGTTTIGGTFTLEDSRGTLIINGDFTVPSGGTVDWSNSHVLVADGVTITVQSGGTLHITGGTMVEHVAGNYHFAVNSGANFIMTDSTLKDCGDSGGTGTGAEAGLYINTSTAALTGNTLTGNYIGLVVGPNATGFVVNGNTIMNNTLWDIYNGRADSLNAENNWWGTDGPDGHFSGADVDHDPYCEAVLSLVPASPPTVIAHGETVTLTLHLDVATGAQANAFVATIRYDPIYLNYATSTYNPTNNPFPIAVEVQHIDHSGFVPGTIRIAGGSTTFPTTHGDIATIIFFGEVVTEHFTTVQFDTTADSYSPGRAASGVWEQGNTFVEGVALPTLTSLASVMVKEHLHITATAGANGAISEAGVHEVPYGESQSYVITANPNYHIEDVLVNGFSVGAVSGYTFTNVVADQTIEATFDINYWVVTIAANSRIADTTPWSVNALKSVGTATFTGVTPTSADYDYSYIFSTSRNGETAVPLATLANFFTTRNYGQDQDLVFTGITGDTTIVVNLFRRGNIAGGAGTLVPDSADLVNTLDAAVLIAQWRHLQSDLTEGQTLVADLNNDQKVDVVDLSMMMSLWKTS